MAITLEPSRNRFDEIRLFAASLVIFSHAYPLFGAGAEPLMEATGHMTFGQVAVAIFFVVSGFLIYRSAEKSTPSRFLVARVLRIVPGATVCALVCVFVLGPALTTLPLAEYLTQPRTWTYFVNAVPLVAQYDLPGVFTTNPYPNAVNGSLWSLPVEIRLYAVCLAVSLLPHPRVVAPLLAVAGLIGAYVVFPALNLPPVHTIFWHLQYGAYFFIGATAYLYRQHLAFSHTGLVVLGCAAVLTVHTAAFPFVMALLLPYAALMAAFAGQKGADPIPWRLGVPDISFGLYIYAFPVQQCIALALGPNPPFLVSLLLSFAITTVLAVLSWHLVERPALAWKSLARPSHRTVPEPAVPMDALAR